MKKILLIAISFFSLATCYAQKSQLPYYDALKLATLLDKTGHFKNDAPSVDTLYTILTKYAGGGITKPSEFKNTSKNPFIASFFNSAQTYGTAFTDVGSAANSAKASFSGNLSTSFADGIAQFLIERGKEELDIAFIDKFKKFLLNYPEARIAFPTTIGFINNVESYNYNAMMPALKAAFQKDLNSLTTNLVKLRDILKDDAYVAAKAAPKPTVAQLALVKRAEEIDDFLNKKVAGRSVIGALLITDGIIKGTNAADVIDDLAQDPAFAVNFTTNTGDILSNSVQMVDLLSGALKSTDDGRIWITKAQIRDLVKDENTFKLFMGLLYAQNVSKYNITFKDKTTITLKAFLTDLNTNWATAEATFGQTFSGMANAANDAADNFKDILNVKNQTDQSSLLLYANYASSLSSFLKSAISLIPDNPKASAAAAQLTAIKSDVTGFTSIIDNLVNSYYYIKSKNYSALVLSTSAVFTEIANAATPDEKAKYSKFKDDYVKYGTFMSSILEAKNGADVKAAIEVVALPAGSYSIKQKSAWNISLNGYIGYGFDINYAHGVYAPVGISGTFGSKRNGVPITFFVSFIDVGSLVTYRLNNGSTDSLKQNVRLESIISLSGQVIFEIPNTPIGLAAGWRRTPKLFYSDDKTFQVKSPKDVFNISLLIDIPIFTLHNKPF